jgi:Cu2+-exporting ATPase/Cu+-exporting ATPase
MVYTMLMAATASPDPVHFKQSDLYRRCMAAGVVPAGEGDLDDILAEEGNVDSAFSAENAAHNSLTLHLKIEGMWCPACSWVVESALMRLGGVQEAYCDFATDRLRCGYDPLRVDPGAIVKTVEGLGYGTSTGRGRGVRPPWSGEFVRLLVSVLLSVNIMMLSWSLYSGFFTSLSSDDIRYISWPIVIMATGVMLFGGAALYRRAWQGLRAGAPGMEALVCLGAVSAYFYSLYNFWAGSWHLYFDTASMLITLVLLGKLLETKAKERVRRDLEGFLALQPNKVRMCSAQHPAGRFVALEQLAPGDIFRVLNQEMVPVDGRVISGNGLVDESAVTGESRPKTIAPGHPLTSGSRLLKGEVTASAIRVGSDALLGQMISIIESGLSKRPHLKSRTDGWLALFVPVILGLAVATTWGGHHLGLSWEAAFVRGLTVLVVACPCALGIAIPLARIAGMSRAGQRGILVRDFEAFERVRSIDGVVMDKTGTLTHGQWSLEKIDLLGKMGKDEALSVVAGLEKGVDHAVARAVLDHCTEQGIAPATVDSVRVSENGVAGTYNGVDVHIGTWDFVSSNDPPEADFLPGHTPLSHVFFRMNGRLNAILYFGDRLWESVPGLIAALKGRGLGTYLISGDTPAATRGVGRIAGIIDVAGGLLPTDKADYVARLQAKGRRVAMLGDGINDAPALAKADLSVAVHRDAALAQQAANVTLMRGDPAQLLDFISLGRRVNAKVVQNLGCAWVYNLIGIPIAMSGLLNPLIAATAMLLSSLTVIGNTLLLVRRR